MLQLDGVLNGEGDAFFGELDDLGVGAPAADQPSTSGDSAHQSSASWW
jgi:hypothetical protein